MVAAPGDFKSSGITSLPGEPAQIEQSCNLAAQVCVRSVAFRLLISSLLLLLVNHFLVCSILGLAKPFWGLAKPGLLASLFAETSNLRSWSSHLSLIVHPEL